MTSAETQPSADLPWKHRHACASGSSARLPASGGKILVIRSGAIGDFIVTLPVLQLLRHAYPSSWLGLIAKNRVHPLVKNVVHGFIDIDGPFLLPFFHDRIDPDSPEYRYLTRFHLIISYLGEVAKVNKNLRALPAARLVSATPLPPDNYARHITDFLLEPLAELLDVSSPPLPTIIIGEEEANFAHTFLSSSGIPASVPLVAVHPGSGSRAKVCPAGNFCKAVNLIQREFPDTKVLAIEGEADAADVSALEQCLNTTCVRVREENLLHLAAILSTVSLFIGNDSGIAHLAAAVGAPSIVVFRAPARVRARSPRPVPSAPAPPGRRPPSRPRSNPAVWAPRGKHVWVASDHSLQHTVRLAMRKLIHPA